MTLRYSKLTAAALLLASGMVAGAEAPAPTEEPAAQPARNGEATRQWLERQRQGVQASDKPQALPGPVMEQVFERYRKSFSHPVPEHIQSEQVNGGTTSR
ncbi:MAG: DUF3613 domain-containing protein [Rhodocyclaceae bacterium]|nr:DUF3613 domain-containing protein [Rhodocyclaceae bacterium]